MAVTDWIQTAALIYFAWQQNQIFKRQNEIFANQAGNGAMADSSQALWIARYWPTLVMVVLVGLTGYDIYARRGTPPVFPLWFYVTFLLIVTLLGLVVVKVIRVTPTRTGIREWRQGFMSPRFEIVNDRKFENEEITVDNKSFRRCSFKNVKLLFHGTAPFEFVEGTTVDAGTVFFTTDDPAIKAFDTMQTQFASIPGAQVQHGAFDVKGKDVPRHPVTVVPLSQYPIPDLRLKILSLCSELQGFLGTHGQEPEVEHKSHEDHADYLKRYLDTVMPWRARVLGAYRLEFGDSVPRLRDEIRVRTGLDNFVLNNFIDAAANNPNGNTKAVRGVVDTLWEMAREINC